jgi:lysophospholipase L1-like esterase
MLLTTGAAASGSGAWEISMLVGDWHESLLPRGIMKVPFFGLFLLLCAGGLLAQGPKKGPVDPSLFAQNEYSHLIYVADDPSLPRVLLIGDSIAGDYTIATLCLLHGLANVYNIPSLGGTTDEGLANLDVLLGKGKWDVIHFNYGLHDLSIFLGQGGLKNDGSYLVPLDRYEKNLRELVRRLKGTGATLIWATTTPVPDADVAILYRKNSDAIAYNAVARKIMEENGIAIDDLYAFALPRLAKIQMPANVHFTYPGSEELAKQVAASIRAALKTRKRD